MTRFATAAELATIMQVPTFTGAELTRANAVLDYASALIRRTCGGQVLEETNGTQEEFAASQDDILFLSQRPVTAVSSVTENAVAFSDFVWTRHGTLIRDGAWSTGPILVTYDHGYRADSDEIAIVKSVCLEAAARAITKEGDPAFQSFGESIVPVAGMPPHLFLMPEERMRLEDFGPVGVG